MTNDSVSFAMIAKNHYNRAILTELMGFHAKYTLSHD